MKLLGEIILPAILLVLIDYIYLNAISSFFNKQIFNIQKSPIQLRFSGAIICYILLVFGLYYFIISQNKKVFDAFILGLVIYGVYESTNYALLKNWKFSTLVIDTLWGGILFALTTYFTYKINKLM